MRPGLEFEQRTVYINLKGSYKIILATVKCPVSCLGENPTKPKECPLLQEKKINTSCDNVKQLRVRKGKCLGTEFRG